METLYRIKDISTGLFFNGTKWSDWRWAPKGKTFLSLRECKSVYVHITDPDITRAKEFCPNPEYIKIIEYRVEENGVVNV